MTVRDNVAMAVMFGRAPRCRWRRRGPTAGAHLETVSASDTSPTPTRRRSTCTSASCWRSPGRSRPSRKVLLLDEALAGLNPAEIDDAVEVIRRIHAAGVSIVHRRAPAAGGQPAGHPARRARPRHGCWPTASRARCCRPGGRARLPGEAGPCLRSCGRLGLACTTATRRRCGRSTLDRRRRERPSRSSGPTAPASPRWSTRSPGCSRRSRRRDPRRRRRRVPAAGAPGLRPRRRHRARGTAGVRAR